MPPRRPPKSPDPARMCWPSADRGKPMRTPGPDATTHCETFHKAVGDRPPTQEGPAGVSTMKTAIKTEGFVFATLWVLPVGAAFLMWLADGTARVDFSSANIFSVRYTMAVLVMMAL